MKIILLALVLVVGCGVVPVASSPAGTSAIPSSPPRQTTPAMTTRVMNVDELVVDDELSLSAYENLEIHARRVEIPATRAITYRRDPCDFSDSPSLTIIAEEDVVIGGAIDLRGKDGVAVARTAGCGRGDGASGGSVSITADAITLTGAIRTGAGAAVRQDAQNGVSGNVELLAATTIGIAGVIMANGGALTWEAPTVTFAEPKTEDATLTNAAVISMQPLTIDGSIAEDDDIASASATDAIFFTPQGGSKVRCSDLYAMVNEASTAVNVGLLITMPDIASDYGVMVAEYDGSQWRSIIAGTGNIKVPFVAKPGTPYLIGVWSGATSVRNYELAMTTATSLIAP